METPKILFKLLAIRNAKKAQHLKTLITDTKYVPIIAAIREKKPQSDLQNAISKALRTIPEYKNTELFNQLIAVYTAMEETVKIQGEATLSSTKVMELFQSIPEQSARQFNTLEQKYGNVLIAIKLSSNRTSSSEKEDFISLLKAWSAMYMYRHAKQHEQVYWIDVYSSTFVIPLRQSDLPRSLGTQPEDKYNAPSETVLKPLNVLKQEYKSLKNKIEQADQVIADLYEFEPVHTLTEKDFNNPQKLNKIKHIELFEPVFRHTKFQSPIDIKDGTKGAETKKLMERLQGIVKVKSTQLTEIVQTLLPDQTLKAGALGSGAALNALLAERTILNSQVKALEMQAAQDFYVNPETLSAPGMLEQATPARPVIPMSDIINSLSGSQKPLFNLLVSDLILVEEKDVGYVASAIAHIETAMQGELRSKTHRTLDRTERRLTSIESTEVKQALNLATNSHSNFQAEIEKAQKSKLGGDANVKYSGGTVKVDVSAYYGNEDKKTKDTIQKAAQEITEEARVEVTRKIEQQRTDIAISELEIINEHKIENTSEEHINGIYQWVDQIKEFRTLSYGRHLMCKLILPDPAKLLFGQKEQDNAGLEMEDFPLAEPTQIDRYDTALRIGKKYGVTDFETPPTKEKMITASIEFSDKTAQAVSAGYVLHNQTIQIPRNDTYKGYYVQSIVVRYNCPWTDPGGSDRKHFTLSVLDTFFAVSSVKGGDDPDQWIDQRFDSNRSNGFTQTTGDGLSGITVNSMANNGSHTNGEILYLVPAHTTLGLDEIPISVITRNSNYFQANILVTLIADAHEEREAFYAWQKQVYDKLYQAYLKQREDRLREARNEKEDKLLNVISGKNPAKNKQLILEEFKRQVITVLTTDSNYTFKGLFTPSAEDYEIRTDEIRRYSQYIDFFENAIDWDKMSYQLFPYYWHQHEGWNVRQTYEDTDPHYEAFMKAGAAEVTIPVQHGYERKFMHFIENGELWNHNEPLSITFDENPDLIAEINEMMEEDKTEPTQIDQPWRARIPTSLIILSQKKDLAEVPPLNETENGEDIES